MATKKTTLRDQLREDQQRRAADAAKKYRELLLENRPGKLAELREVMSTLGLSPDDVDADHDALAAAATARGLLVSPEQRAAAEAEVEQTWLGAIAEARATLLQLFDRLPRGRVLDVVSDVYSAVIQATEGQEEIAAVAKLDVVARLWGAVNNAELALSRRLERAKAAAAELAALAAAYPRVLGPTTEVPEADIPSRARDEPTDGPITGRKGQFAGRSTPGKGQTSAEVAENDGAEDEVRTD